jgi:hypothetical protein
LVTDLVRLEAGYLFYNDYRIGLIFLKNAKLHLSFCGFGFRTQYQADHIF